MKGLEKLAQRVASARRVVAFTGAGISTESGIADFRSPGGVWSRFRPVQYDEFLASHEARLEYWRMRKVLYAELSGARPNAGHLALAGLEQVGRLAAVITQNIDGLHQEAGSRKVLELHGTARQVACVSCEQRWPAPPFFEQYRDRDEVPVCEHCGGWLKSATVSFGQILPQDVLAESFELAGESDLFLAIGSSLVVEPAASIPLHACRLGADLIIINRDQTPLDDLAMAVVREPIGQALQALADPSEGSS